MTQAECHLFYVSGVHDVPEDPIHGKGAGWPCGSPLYPGPYTGGSLLSFESEITDV